MRTKFIVTNIAALQKKYGSSYSKIDKAVKQLIAADAARQITTTVWDVSDAATMKGVGGKAVASVKSAKQNKDAIDAIYRKGKPDYLMIFGSIDVIPHQDLKNPVFDGVDDNDKTAWGDLPYACEHAYSTDVNDFIAPTRVVGRLPDITGASDPKHLVKVLGNAATWIPLAPSHYNDYFALSTESWQKSTKLSVKKVFGNSKNVFLSPTAGPQWKNSELKPLPHFINCHGASGRMSFYGENASKTLQPESHQTVFVRNNIERGTVAAVECCYGAELYKPSTATSDKENGICQEYLHDDAYGFFGSTTIAYGPADSMGSADLICAAFLKHVREGDSLGLAALKARQDFVKDATQFDPTDQKTLAQFNLLGDPSIHPVQEGSKAKPKNVAKPKGPLGLKSAVSVAKAQPKLDDGHRARRAHLAKRGPEIAAQTSVVRAGAPADADAAARARAAVEQRGGKATHVVAFQVDPPAVAPKGYAKKALGVAGAASYPKRIFLVKSRQEDAPPTISIKAKGMAKTSKAATPPVKRFSVSVVHEQSDGTMKVVRELFAK